MLLIYTPIVKPRLKYIFELIFGEVMGMPFKFTDDKEHFVDFIGAKLNYSQEIIDKELFLYQDSFLLEKGIQPAKFAVGTFKDLPCFFVHNHPDSIFPFDFFAASFYLVSRYEEYLEFTADEHKRFPASASLAHQLGFLEKPIVNIWTKHLKERIQLDYPRLEVKAPHSFTFIPTYDIDIAYSYLSKGVLRHFGGYLNSLRSFDWHSLFDRTETLIGKIVDPYDTYDYQKQFQDQYNLKPLYFFLVGEYGPFDKNISIDQMRYQDLIQSISDHAGVGIHPSYRSNEEPKRIATEIQKLSDVVKREIIRSRQHYLRLRFPDTYESLINLGIEKEYSMGFADAPGFRAGIASSFLFYDLSRERCSALRVYPFAFMEVTMRFYLGLDVKKSLLRLRKIIEEVKAVDGLFMAIWHNHSLSEKDGWDGWRKVYEKMMVWGTV